MTTFDSTKLPLKDLLKDIVNGKIQLPDFGADGVRFTYNVSPKSA